MGRFLNFLNVSGMFSIADGHRRTGSVDARFALPVPLDTPLNIWKSESTTPKEMPTVTARHIFRSVRPRPASRFIMATSSFVFFLSFFVFRLPPFPRCFVPPVAPSLSHSMGTQSDFSGDWRLETAQSKGMDQSNWTGVPVRIKSNSLPIRIQSTRVHPVSRTNLIFPVQLYECPVSPVTTRIGVY